MNLAVFLSGRGSDFKAILDATRSGKLNARVVLVISNNPDAGGLKIADASGIPTAVFDRSQYADGAEFGGEMLAALREKRVELIALAGYLRKIPPTVIRAYPRRILNIHPALLPKFGGKGMFGLNVHQAVIAAGETESGVTIHLVDEVYDHGEIVAQSRIPVRSDDTAESLASRVLDLEHSFYPEVLQKYISELNSSGQ